MYHSDESTIYVNISIEKSFWNEDMFWTESLIHEKQTITMNRAEMFKDLFCISITFHFTRLAGFDLKELWCEFEWLKAVYNDFKY